MTPIISIEEVQALVEIVRRAPMSAAEGMFCTALFGRIIDALSPEEAPPAEPPAE